MSTKLILLSMVKSEARIIERLMTSVRGRADAIIICDTGSTDDTQQLATRLLAENEIPGSVYSFPFRTFGKSRTESFHCAQDWLSKQDPTVWNPEQCWCLLLDGDMMLPDNTNPTALKAVLGSLGPQIAGASMRQENGNLVYSNVRLIRASEPWICKGATHEAWTCPPSKQTFLMQEPVLKDLNDGGSKADKYTRDERLLLEDLAEMPNDARTLYHLGQTYQCMNDMPKAIETYRRRIAVGGWDEENYIAMLHLGECLLRDGQEGAAVAAFLDAWQYRPHRTEAAMRLIQHYRKKPKAQMIAMMFLEKLWALQKGETLEGAPSTAAGINRDLLFVNWRDMDVGFWEELGILAYYHGNKRAAWLRMDEYDLTNNLGWHDFNGIFANAHWYDWLLKPRRQTRFAIPLERLPWAKEAEAACWQPFNPSIRVAPDKKSYWLNLRFANYWTEEAKHYAFRAFQGQVLTRNCFCVVPQEAGWNQPASVEEIVIDPKFPQREGHHIRGIEDCRWIQNSERQEFLGTSQSYSDSGRNRIFHVWRDVGETTWSLRQMPLPATAREDQTQKNWLGFRDGASAELKYLYDYSPFQVMKESGEPATVSPRTQRGDGSPYALKEHRGSAGPVPWSSAAFPEEKYLCVIHKVYIGGDGRRYYHRFMTLDGALRPSRVSCWVRMTNERVEYWSGMCASLEGDSVWITYGLKDSQAYIAEMRLTDIEPLLFYSFEGGAKTLPAAERLRRLTLL